MENLDVLVRGVVMQNPGLGLGTISFQGLEWAWVAVAATVVLALLSVKRVSIVSVGWTWGAKPGQVRVRVQSFSSLTDGNCIVTTRGMFSAELLNSSADSCSEAASSSSDCVSDAASKVAEMVFIFEKKTTSLLLPRQQPSAIRSATEKGLKRRRKLEDFLNKSTLLYSGSQPAEGVTSVSRREGIEWDPGTSPPFLHTSDRDSLLPTWAQSLTKPLLYRASPINLCIARHTPSCEFDPLLKLRIRDAVFSGNKKYHSIEKYRLPLAPVSTKDLSSIATLQDGVVRLWDSDAKSLKTTLHLPKSYNGVVSAFDVDWDSKVAAIGRVGGLVSLTNLKSSAYTNCYQTQNSIVQALHLEGNSSSNTVFTGGPTIANAGCSLSLWDSRSSSRELSMNLRSATAIHGIRSQAHELLVRDEVGSLAAHDVRMLGASNVSRITCDMKCDSAPQDRWWDIDTTLVDEEEDIDDEFWDCQTSDELKSCGGSLVGNIVLAMSRGFHSK